MGRIVDFIRQNVFWLANAACLIVLAAVFLVVVRGLGTEVETRRTQIETSEKNLDGLVEKAKKGQIPNEGMIAAAQAEQAKLRAMYGQLEILWAGRPAWLDQPFRTLRDVGPKDDITWWDQYVTGRLPFKGTDEFGWWGEYETRTRQLLKDTQDQFEVAEAALSFAVRHPTPIGDLAGTRELQRRFWIQKKTLDALAAASPKTNPLIRKLLGVRAEITVPSGPANGWWRAAHVLVNLQMCYQDLPKLIAGLQNYPTPVMVTAYSVARTGPGPAAVPPAAASGTEDLVEVVLQCQIVEFRPALVSIAFSGPLFKDVAALRTWLAKEDAALNGLLEYLVAEMPPVRERVEAVAGATLDDLRKAADDDLARELKKIDDDAAATLAAQLKAAAPPDGKPVPPERLKAIKDFVDAATKQRKDAAQSRSGRMFRLPGRSVDFSVLYDLLTAVAPHRAYSLGAVSSASNFVLLARAPDAATMGPGRWWLARWDPAPGKHTLYPLKADGKPCSRDEIIRELIPKAGPARTPLAADPAQPDKATLIVDDKTGEVTEVLVQEASGVWLVCPAVRADAKALWLSDAAFRFAVAIQTAAGAADRYPIEPPRMQIDLAPVSLFDGITEHDIAVRDGSDGAMKVKTGLRK